MEVGASQQRMAAFLRDNHDKVVDRWSELVAAGLRGRTSPREARRELEDLYSLIIRDLPGTDEHAGGELRAVLDELSRSRARDGFTPSETALSVFSLKEAVYELVADSADHAVIDITGVPTVDTEVAQHLLKTVSAARLLGAECTISGIWPQVAQTIVGLGIEFGDVATKATLADALALALRQAGLKVVPA